MASRPTLDTEQTIDFIRGKIRLQYPNQFADVTFGEFANYTPDMFQGSRGETLPIVAVTPVYDRLMPETRTKISEVRARGVDIVTIVNMLEEIQAKPPEKTGERVLIRNTQYLIDFLASQDMEDLEGQSEFTQLGDITWEWLVGDKQIYRSSRIHLIVYARLNKIKE